MMVTEDIEISDDWIRPSEAARLLSITYARIYQLRLEGKLQHILKVPGQHLYSKTEVEAYAASRASGSLVREP